MKIPIVFGLLFLTLISCKTVQPIVSPEIKTTNEIKEPDYTVYFKASGNEPFGASSYLNLKLYSDRYYQDWTPLAFLMWIL